MVEFGYGEIYSRPGLDDRARQLTAIAALTAIGGAEPQLEYHIGIALNIGIEPAEIVETIIHLVPFIGFARTLERRAIGQARVRLPRHGAATRQAVRRTRRLTGERRRGRRRRA